MVQYTGQTHSMTLAWHVLSIHGRLQDIAIAVRKNHIPPSGPIFGHLDDIKLE